jgi:hypothetical protein
MADEPVSRFSFLLATSVKLFVRTDVLSDDWHSPTGTAAVKESASNAWSTKVHALTDRARSWQERGEADEQPSWFNQACFRWVSARLNGA